MKIDLEVKGIKELFKEFWNEYILPIPFFLAFIIIVWFLYSLFFGLIEEFGKYQ